MQCGGNQRMAILHGVSLPLKNPEVNANWPNTDLKGERQLRLDSFYWNV